MRSTQKDIRRITPLTTLNPIVSATSGNGVFADGTPWHMIRTATGEYTINFDPRLFPISGAIGPMQGARIFYYFEVAAAGSIRVQCLDYTGAAINATNFDVTIMCLDTRV
jgi:hypothetical protein